MTSVPDHGLTDQWIDGAGTGEPGEMAVEVSHEQNIVTLFLQIGIGLGRDARLRKAPAAVAVYMNIRGHAPGFPIFLSTIQRQTGWGREAVTNALKLLEALGYLRRTRARADDGTYGRWLFHTNDAPPGSPQAAMMLRQATKLITELTSNNGTPVDNSGLDMLAKLAAAGFAPPLTSNSAFMRPPTGNPSVAPTGKAAAARPVTGFPSVDLTSNPPPPWALNSWSGPATGQPAPVNPSDIEEEGGGEKEKEQQLPPAPLARSTGDARRAPYVSDARESGGASAATNGPKAAGRTASEISGTVPPAKRKAAKDDLKREDRGGILPVPLARAVSAQAPRLPNLLVEFYAVALAENGRAKMAARVARRFRYWTSGGRTFAEHEVYGTLHSPIGVLYELLADPECQYVKCEDGFYTDSDKPCEYCIERLEARRADQAARRRTKTTVDVHAKLAAGLTGPVPGNQGSGGSIPPPRSGNASTAGMGSSHGRSGDVGPDGYGSTAEREQARAALLAWVSGDGANPYG